MIKIQTKEHLVYFMQCGMMKLSHYDLKFVQNLHHLIIINQPITTNQITLFEKLINKYQKQFNKHKLSQNLINNLQWHVGIVQSSPEFTEAYLNIIDNNIFVKAPFNKKFLQALRDITPNPFKWNREEKRYEGAYSTYSLKIIKELLEKNYTDINYCETTKNLINKIQDFNTQDIWSPTIVCANQRLYIGAINSFVDDATKSIPLELDINTVAKLSMYGISLSKDLSTQPKLNFASQFVYETDVDKIIQVVDWLAELKCDCVLFSGLNIQKNRQELHDKLLQLKIDFYNQSDILFSSNKIFMKPYNYVASIHFNNIKINPSLVYKHDLKKIIKVMNSYPINVK